MAANVPDIYNKIGLDNNCSGASKYLLHSIENEIIAWNIEINMLDTPAINKIILYIFNYFTW